MRMILIAAFLVVVVATVAAVILPPLERADTAARLAHCKDDARAELARFIGRTQAAGSEEQIDPSRALAFGTLVGPAVEAKLAKMDGDTGLVACVAWLAKARATP
jgi:hypothetical protein